MITKIHKENLKLIKKYNLFEGKVLRLLNDYSHFKKGDAVTISGIHSYGWITFKETEQLPQKVSELLKITDLSYTLGCGRKFNRNGKISKKDVAFICGVANAWGENRLCPTCKNKLKERWKEDNLKKLKGGNLKR